MAAASERHCPACGAHSPRLLESLSFRVFDSCPVAGCVDLVSCGDCGLGYYSTPSRQADYDRYYAQNGYYATAQGAGAGGHSAAEVQRFDARAQLLRRHCREANTVMDVGCGRGGLLSRLQAAGFERAIGVDPNPDCVQLLHDQSQLEAEHANAVSFVGRADLLIYSHVLEHVIDLAPLIQHAQQQLQDGGYIYVEVPDAAQYGKGGLLPYHELFLEHVNHFSEDSLHGLFARHDFRCVASGQTEVFGHNGAQLPCLWGIFQRGSSAVPATDHSLHQALANYLKNCRAHPMQQHIEQLPKQLWLWGVSQHAMLLLGSSGLKERNLLGLLDIDPYKQQQRIDGLPISAPQDVKLNDESVLITADAFRTSIARHLHKLGHRGPLHSLSDGLYQE
ncbi:MAG: hypothetical protein CMP23_17035 [Rickettsiales bacterium]|nr:hypothetical protein [Rickettsiales bacterium]